MDTKNTEKHGICEVTEASKIENGKMNRIWWLGTSSGVISTLVTWSCYSDFGTSLNNMPTLLALFILIGVFWMIGLFLKNIAFYFYDTIKQLLKKLMEIVLSNFGFEISCMNHRLFEVVVKINLLKVGAFVLILTILKYYDFLEKVDAVFKSLPLWVLILIDLVGALSLFLVYLRLRRKRRLQKSSLNGELQKDTGQTAQVG